jgi:hypothetical protein
LSPGKEPATNREKKMDAASKEILWKAVAAVRAAVEEVDKDGLGVPETGIHLALAQHGCSPSMATAMITALVEAGKIKKSGHQLYAVREA